jgi:hypothetical protein
MQNTVSENLSIGVIRIVIGVAIAGGIAKGIVVLALLERVPPLGLPVNRNEARCRHREASVHQDAVDVVALPKQVDAPRAEH